jgi:hypothetical protein
VVCAAFDLANESRFSGNTAALNELADTLKKGDMVAFAGAGVSVPLAPTWHSFLHELIGSGISEGFISNSDEEYLRRQVINDPLELACTLEELFTKPRFRSRLSEVFHLSQSSTEAHESVVRLPFESVFTLNFDEGISTAYVKIKGLMPSIIRNDDSYELARWQQGAHKKSSQFPIIHWHGNVSAPDRMIFTADDYNKFYGIQKNVDFISELWRSRSILAIGFGFSDPFLTRVVETVLRNHSAGNSHYAIIGKSGEAAISMIERKFYAKKYRLTPIFYSILENPDGREDHSELGKILEYLASITSDPTEGRSTKTTVALSEGRGIESSSPAVSAKGDFEKSLLVGQNGVTLYVDPRLYRPSDIRLNELNYDESQKYFINDLVNSSKNFIVLSGYELGASTLGRRLVYETILAGNDAVMLDARDLPDYKAKLSNMDAFKRRESSIDRLLILDNVNLSDHERLLKEIIGLGAFDHYVLLSRRNSQNGSDLADLGLPIPFEPLVLAQLQREDIRALANQLYDTFDSDMVAAAVEKTYTDLLALCIPLTPSNVIMYISVIYREGSFVALNRLQIMDKYIRDRIQRPSDAYRDAFNVDNKIELLSKFVHFLFDQSKAKFSKKEWDYFCEKEMERSLFTFDKEELIKDLVEIRLIIPIDGIYSFKYKLFYSYLLGKYVGERPDLIPNFVDQGKHLAVESLVEALAGTSKDNTYLVTALVEQLEKSVADFAETYKTGRMDPYASLEWALTEGEEEKVWRPVAERLANGPASDAEVDKVKRSILAEQRTENQTVIVHEFNMKEASISFNQHVLNDALRESSDLEGSLKIRAVQAILDSYQTVMQIGFLFSPIIATRKYFVWNSIAFFNNINFDDRDDFDLNRKAGVIANAIPHAVTDRAVAEMGSKKLGQVYKHMLRTLEPSGFSEFVLFSLLIRSKPDNWEIDARNVINKIEKRALYLKYMLNEAMNQFRQDVNTNADRSALKRIVAAIQAKRKLNKKNPTSKTIAGVLKKLEEGSYFSKK